MDYLIRPLTATDEPILWEMLYQALHTSEGAPAPDVVREPQYSRYVENWGQPGDTGFVAFDAAQKESLLGAVWLRSLGSGAAENAGSTSDLAFAVRPGMRRQGLGAALLTQLVKANPQHSSIVIHAAANNPAVRLYERFGFKVIGQGEGSVTMQR